MLAHEEAKNEISPFQTILLIIAVIVFIVVTASLLSPAILVIRPFVGSFEEAYSVALNSFWAWMACIAFWAAVAYSIRGWRDSSYKRSLKRTRSARAPSTPRGTQKLG